MRLSTRDYHSTADALAIEAKAGSNPAEQERLISTAKLAKRMAQLAYERRQQRSSKGANGEQPSSSPNSKS